MIRILKYFKWHYWVIVALIVGIVVAQVQIDLILPEYMGEIVKLVTSYGTQEEIWQAGWKMILCAAGGFLCTVAASFLTARLAAGFSQILRKKVFDKVESFSLEEISTFSTASLITR